MRVYAPYYLIYYLVSNDAIKFYTFFTLSKFQIQIFARLITEVSYVNKVVASSLKLNK